MGGSGGIEGVEMAGFEGHAKRWIRVLCGKFDSENSK
jgi:hypothetical protein